LSIRDGEERAVRDGLDEAVAEQVERGAEGAHRLLSRDGVAAADDAGGVERRHALLNLRVDGSVVDERAARRVYEVVVRVVVPGPQLDDLTDAAGHRVLMALAAGLRVVDRAESVVLLVNDAEDEFVGGEGAGRRLGRG